MHPLAATADSPDIWAVSAAAIPSAASTEVPVSPRARSLVAFPEAQSPLVVSTAASIEDLTGDSIEVERASASAVTDTATTAGDTTAAMATDIRTLVAASI